MHSRFIGPARRHRLRALAFNTLLVLVSLAFAVLVLGELVVFRVVLPASDVPANAVVDGVMRYVPHQSGTWRVRDEIAAPFRINAQGWNSAKPDYAAARRAGVARVTLIGDSYVEAFQVPFDRSVAEILEARLGHADVLRYGMSGAPLSQYLHMLERAALPAKPDLALLLLVHNDFDESFKIVTGRYTSSFLKLDIAHDREVREIDPAPYRPGPWNWLRLSATSRALHYRWGVTPYALRIRLMTLLGGVAAPGALEANIDVAPLSRNLVQERRATDHVFARLAALAGSRNVIVALAMDANRAAIYENRDPLSGAGALNRLAAELAAKHGLPFLDLTAAFSSDFIRHKRRFEFMGDGHWNEHAHAVAASALADFVRPLLPQQQ